MSTHVCKWFPGSQSAPAAPAVRTPAPVLVLAGSGELRRAANCRKAIACVLRPLSGRIGARSIMGTGVDAIQASDDKAADSADSTMGSVVQGLRKERFAATPRGVVGATLRLVDELCCVGRPVSVPRCGSDRAEDRLDVADATDSTGTSDTSATTADSGAPPGSVSRASCCKITSKSCDALTGFATNDCGEGRGHERQT